MNIVVFGANGPTGRLLTAQALDAGHTVTAFTRRPGEYPLVHPRLTVAGGDVHDPVAVDAAVDGQDAVLSTLGVPFGREPITVYSGGIGNVVRAMENHGVRRLVVVSSSVTDPTAGPHGGFFFEKVLQPYVTGVLGKTLYDDMRRMESLVRQSTLDWTIVRPSGLFEAAAVGDYLTAENHLGGKFTSRADLASCVLRQATDTSYLRKVVAVTTVGEKPSLFQLIWKEGIGKKA